MRVLLYEERMDGGMEGFVNIEKPAYLEKQHEYQLIIPLRCWNHTYAD
jgi:hypothetical protein